MYFVLEDPSVEGILEKLEYPNIFLAPGYRYLDTDTTKIISSLFHTVFLFIEYHHIIYIRKHLTFINIYVHIS